VAASVVVHIDVAADGAVHVWLSKSKVRPRGGRGPELNKRTETTFFSRAGPTGWVAFSMDVWEGGELMARRRTVFAHLGTEVLWTIGHKVVPCAQRACATDRGKSRSLAADMLYAKFAAGVCFVSGSRCFCTEQGFMRMCSACLVEVEGGVSLYAGDTAISLVK
jgi:hypothetical protein